MRRALAPFSSLALLLGALALGAAAQPVNPPVPAPTGPVNPPGTVASAAPAVPTPPMPGATTAAPGSPLPGTSEEPLASPTPSATPTQPPIIVDPPQVGVEPGKIASARINSALGTVTVTVANPAVATAVVDQAQRVLFVTGVALGTTTATVTDQRGLTRDVPIRVAYAAGVPADATTVSVTGDPASADYLRSVVADAVTSAATLRAGASAQVLETVPIHGDLAQDDQVELDVPVTLSGDGYFTVNGSTHVTVQNVAMPPIQPARLLVSDYPERLTANGVLFTAHLDRTQAQRFLYYHYNPGTEPPRRILLKAHNSGNVPAVVQLINGSAGPEGNELEVGHLSTSRFLVRQSRNEGLVVSIPPGATSNLLNAPLPPQNVVSGILQLRLVSGDPVDLTLLAQDASAPLDQSISTTELLAGGAPHARGVYPVPTFYFDRTYDVDGPDLEIPIGQLPLPNLREGEALAGDYGVEQSMNVVIVNMTRGPHSIALYANPRGGRATGTFLIDGTLVQAHGLPAFSRFKIWQDTIQPGTFQRVRVVTMPEGGSSYPLRLVFAQDDGSVAPGLPGSPVY
ncbi:MAG TPA: pilus assembly protein N-terminal domain-containing protein [Candidatus Sulfotelmatobacter sp.]|nr:pilus assembly protein N-terminal domain-containing protein [Candidatus Sulfotelmatobacter sp.]